MFDGERNSYRALYHLTRTMQAHSQDARKVMQTALLGAGDLTGIQQGCLVTFDSQHHIASAYVLDLQNIVADHTTLWEILLANGLIGFVYQSHRTVVIHDITTDPRWPRLPEHTAIPRQGSVIGLPLYRGVQVFGVMMFFHPRPDFFDESTVRLLEEIAGITADTLSYALSAAENKAARYQSLFDDAVVPMILTDLDGTVVDINQKARDLFLWETHQIMRRSIGVIHPELNLHAVIDGGLSGLLLNEEMTFHASALTEENCTIPVLVRVRRLQIDGRDLVEWVEQDFTTHMKYEQLRRDLSAMVYHDLRGPLAAIHGSIQKLAQVLANHENPAVLSLLQIGIRSTRQLRRMIDSLLDVQRIEEGSAIIDRQPVEVRVLVADAIQLVQPMAVEMNQHIHIEVAPDLPLIEVDSDMILRVIINLLENAIKYTPAGGTIRLCAGLDGAFVALRVSDAGPGIPKDMQTRIFDKFNRIRHQNAPRGLGLGLAFCRLAVETHGGTIWVESEEGRGSTFVFRLPLDAPPASEKNSVIEFVRV